MRRVILFMVIMSVCATSVFGQRRNRQDGLKEIGNFVDRPAEFVVTTDVVNERVMPFTATIGTIGNTLMHIRNGAFEPKQWRDRLWAAADAPDRVYTNGISGNGRFASGFLDGADVMVFRPIDGKMRLVRQDKVPEGGCVIEYWEHYQSQAVKPDITQYTWQWRDTTAAGQEVWLTVFAVDKAGNLSEAGGAVKVTTPENPGEAKAKNDTFRYNIPRRSNDEVPPPAPTGLEGRMLENGLVETTWNKVDVDDLQGYVVGFTATDPAAHRGQYLALAEGDKAGAGIKQGDLVIVSKEIRPMYPELITPFFRNHDRLIASFNPPLVSFASWRTPGVDWRLADHQADTPVDDPGQTYLELSLEKGKSVELASRDIAAADQNYYNVPQDTDYVVEVWLKSDRDSAPPVKFQVTGNKDVGESLPNLSFQPTTEWKHFREVVRAKRPREGTPGMSMLIVEGAATYSIDNFRIYRADTPYLRLVPEEVKRIKDSGTKVLRTHSPIKTGTDTYSMELFTNDGGAIRGIKNGNTLPQLLDCFKQTNVNPWLQIEMHMRPEEWHGFVEYMVAPYDPSTDTPQSKPWAFKRHSQGYEKPWVDVFDEIYFEISNETWNWSFNPWVFEGMKDGATGENYNRGAVYGMFNDWVIETMRSSPYWSDDVEEKFRFVIGGWMRSNYGWQAAEHGEHGDYYTIANYIRGWDGARYDEKIASASPANFFELLQYAYQGSVPTLMSDLEYLKELRAKGKDIRLGTYEAGPGYSFGNAQENRAQELVGKSKASGTATMDNFLILARYGYELHNFFTYSEGARWSSHAPPQWGGQGYPNWLMVSLFNREASGAMLDTKVASVSTIDMPGKGRTRDTRNAPLADVYATRDGDRVSIFCLSREYPGIPEGNDGYTPMRVKLPFSSAEKVTLYRMTGDLTDNNIHEKNVSIESVAIGENMNNMEYLTIDQNSGADDRGLPPGEIYLYVFEGTDIGPAGRKIDLEEMMQRPVSFEPEGGRD
ncbi:MAG: hypothetical protein ACOC29_00080 [Candidatus Sumerlaeota bacterium]